MKGVVAAGDERTAKAGLWALEHGGNAYDAVVGALFAAHLAEPALTSPAGGGFILSSDARGQSEFYDFFVDVPSADGVEQKDFFPIEVDFGSAVQVFHVGHASIAVPGIVRGLIDIHSEKGRLPLADVLQPAIDLARSGFHLSPFQAYTLRLLEPIYRSGEASRALYLRDNRLVNESDLFTNPEYGDFISELGRQGGELFYSGEVAELIDAINRVNGGLLRREHLQGYRTNRAEPIRFAFKEYEVITSPPPSLGGFLLRFTFNLLSGRLNETEWGSLTHIGHLAEAMCITQKFRKEGLGRYFAKDNGSCSDPDAATLARYADLYGKAINRLGNTTHISITDADGNAVSCTSSNGEGAGVIIPGTGVMLNNMLGEEDLNPNGFFQWPAGIRLPSMMAPTIILKNGAPHLVLGSSGSNRIRSAILQTVINMLCFDQSIEQAVQNQRVHFENDVIYLEPGFHEDVVAAVEREWTAVLFAEKNLFFGGVHAVTGDLQGAADRRRDGFVATTG
ncbi:MAG: gamma-glutamyltransferase [Desulfuromonas sp.]|nr:MAG: gamma-glutamyltransferase [Desulfuromonas sp.]